MDSVETIQIIMQQREAFVSRIRKRCGTLPASHAEDIFQLAVLDLHKALESGSIQGLAVSASYVWKAIYSHVGNVIRHENAKKRGGEYTIDGFRGESELGVLFDEDTAEKREELTRLMRFVNALPERQAEAIRLRYFEGCTIQEIAELLQTSSEAAVGLLKRGKKSLRVQIEGHDKFAATRKQSRRLVAC